MSKNLYESDVKSIGANIILKGRLGPCGHFDLYRADIEFEGVFIPVMYRKYKKGRGRIDCFKNKYLDEDARNSLKRLRERLAYNYDNNINGMKRYVNRRTMYTVCGIALFVESLALAIVFWILLIRGAAYLPCLLKGTFCLLISVYVLRITDVVTRD